MQNTYFPLFKYCAIRLLPLPGSTTHSYSKEFVSGWLILSNFEKYKLFLLQISAI